MHGEEGRCTIKHPCAPDCKGRSAECKMTCTRWAAYWERKKKEYKRREEYALKRVRPYDP